MKTIFIQSWKKQDQQNSRCVIIGIGVVALLLGLFAVVDPFLTHTVSCEELTDATIEIQQVEYYKYEGIRTYSVEDSRGERYIVVGKTTQDMNLTQCLRPGDRVTIQYQPAYYRYHNAIQYLWLNGQQLVKYRNIDRFRGVTMTVVGGVLMVLAIVLLVQNGRNEHTKKA